MKTLLRSIRVHVVAAMAFSLWTAEFPVSGQISQPAAPASFRIAGTVIGTSGATLPQTRITLRGVKDPQDVQSIVTGDDGRFSFQVKAGKYSLHGAKRGFISSNYDQHDQYSSAIVTGAGVDAENLLFKLAPSASLSGRVLDESGGPVRGARVILWREDHMTGVSRISRIREDMADDEGFYEFMPLNAGTYFLSASAAPWYAVYPPTVDVENLPPVPTVVDRGLDVVYPTTYYSGATDSDDATPIALRGGDRPELELRLSPVPSIHVIFHTQPGTEGGGYPMPVLRKSAFDGFEPNRLQPHIQAISPNAFELITAPGKYSVELHRPTENAQNVRIKEIDLTQNHQVIDTARGEELCTVQVSVQITGEGRIPPELFLVLRGRKERRVTFHRVDSRGEVQFPNVAPGTYEVLAGSSTKAYSVVRVGVEGRGTSGHILKVPAGASLNVSFTLAAGNESVEGVATRGGKGLAGAMVVLVPKHPETNLDLFRRDQSDLDGSFSLQRVIPGTYTIVAIADGWDLDWSRPAVISRYATQGQTVVVPENSGLPITLPQPIEVQAK